MQNQNHRSFFLLILIVILLALPFKASAEPYASKMLLKVAQVSKNYQYVFFYETERSPLIFNPRQTEVFLFLSNQLDFKKGVCLYSGKSSYVNIFDASKKAIPRNVQAIVFDEESCPLISTKFSVLNTKLAIDDVLQVRSAIENHWKKTCVERKQDCDNGKSFNINQLTHISGVKQPDGSVALVAHFGEWQSIILVLKDGKYVALN